VTHFIRYRSGASACYGILEGDTVREIRGDLFGGFTETVAALNLADVALLHPCQPGKIVCVGLNYRSHVGSRPVPEHPEIFFKPVSSLQDPEGPIVTPPDSTDMHYEGELVVVIGRQTKNASVDQARDAIFGVTCGNDVSERNWQHGPAKDMQWWRAKGCDTFAPLGPAIVTGLDYDTLLLRTRLNGEVVQKQYTSDLIFDCPTIVSYISRWVTLMPGDIIYTGTPGATRKMSPGDVVEVEIEGIGILRNPVT
jgi:2-keto-4-pentenoate hydratase/2-oxohepta-3-ene-1,7-dioic acid hydratase in catechol pathway